jgi:Hsp70 protein
VTPSYVAFTESERLIGDAAKNQAALNPQNTIFDAKYFHLPPLFDEGILTCRRLIGRRFDDPEVVKDRKQWPFTVVDNGEGAPLVEVDYLGERKKFTPQEISSMVLLKMKQISEAKYPPTHSTMVTVDSARKLKRQSSLSLLTSPTVNVMPPKMQVQLQDSTSFESSTSPPPQPSPTVSTRKPPKRRMS